MKDRALPAGFLLLLLGPTLIPSAEAADQEGYRYTTPPSGTAQGVYVYAACTAVAPLTPSCTTGDHTWQRTARLGILFSCPTCAFEGVVTSRVTHSSGTFDFACELHSVPMATLGACSVTGSRPQTGETVRHDCVSSAVSVGRYACAFVAFA